MKSMTVRRFMGLIAISGLLTMSENSLLAKEDQDSEKKDKKSQEQSKDSKQEQRRTTEASKDELKVSPDQLSKTVTDANKASKLIGMQVKNTENEDIGKVKELVVDTQSGKIAYAVVSAGGGLIGGGKMVAVPFEALSLQPGAKNLVMNIKKEEFKNARGFAEKSWPSLDAVKSGQTIGIASQGESSDKAQSAGGSGSGAQKSEGSSQSSTNQPSSTSPDQPSKSEDKTSPSAPASPSEDKSPDSGSSDSADGAK